MGDSSPNAESAPRGVPSEVQGGHTEASDSNSHIDERLQQISATLVKLQQDQLDLRGGVVDLRSSEIYEIRHSVDSLLLKINVGLIVGSIVGTLLLGVLGFWGFTKGSDFFKLAETTVKDTEKTIKRSLDESLVFYDQAAKAVFVEANRGCKAALPLYKALLERRKDDEVIFANLLNCYIESGDFKGGYEVFSEWKEKRLFPAKFEAVLSFNNAGWLAFVLSLSDPQYKREAFELLSRAEAIGVSTADPNLRYPLLNLAVMYLAQNKLDEASAYARRHLAMDREGPNFSCDLDSEWFKSIVKNRPSAKKDLQRMFPNIFKSPKNPCGN